METKNKDLLIKNFMLDNMHEIDDNGFSERVSRKLPESKKQKNHNWIILLTGFLGLLVSLVLGVSSGALHELIIWIVNIPVLYFSFLVFCIPIVVSACYFLFYERSLRII